MGPYQALTPSSSVFRWGYRSRAIASIWYVMGLPEKWSVMANAEDGRVIPDCPAGTVCEQLGKSTEYERARQSGTGGESRGGSVSDTC